MKKDDYATRNNNTTSGDTGEATPRTSAILCGRRMHASAMTMTSTIAAPLG